MELHNEYQKTDFIKKDRRLNISRTNPRVFTFGSTLKDEDAAQITEDREYTFLVFRVSVGRSYCHKLQPAEVPEEVPLQDGFDSVYIDETMRADRSDNLFQMKYLVYHPDNVLLTYVIKTKIKVDEIEKNKEVNICKFCT